MHLIKHILDYHKEQTRTLRISEDAICTNDHVRKFVIATREWKLPRPALPFNSALSALWNTAEVRKLFILRTWKGALHPLKCNLDHVKELHVLLACPFPLSRRHNSFSFQLKMKVEQKMSFYVGRKNHRRKLSWLFRREMLLRMSKTSDTWSLQTRLF